MPAFRKPKGFREQPRSYEVGKGRPPVSTQFRPGQSGNPKGRPRGHKNLATLFADAFAQKLEIKENGRIRKITVKEAIVIRLVKAALDGDLKAIAYLLEIEPEIARTTMDYGSKTNDPKDPHEATRRYLELVRATRFHR
jgi:hypothetical protein